MSSSSLTKELTLVSTWKSKKGEVGQAVKYALTEGGYRHIDCASNYLNEDEIGDVLTEVYQLGLFHSLTCCKLLQAGTLKREDVWITGEFAR